MMQFIKNNSTQDKQTVGEGSLGRDKTKRKKKSNFKV